MLIDSHFRVPLILRASYLTLSTLLHVVHPSLQQLATEAERVACMSQQQLPQPAQMFYRKVGEHAYEHLDPSLQYNITLKDCGYDLPGPHDIWVAVDMSVLYGLSNPAGETTPHCPSGPSMLNIGCILVYLKYYTLNLMPLMVYPKLLKRVFIVASHV